MVIDTALLKTIYRELFTRHGFSRMPERDLVMDDPTSVAAYVRGGRPDGALAGNYLYHVAQMCEVIRPGDRVLDLACGPANLLMMLASQNPDVRFVGVDLSDEMLGYARRGVEERKLANVELQRDDMTKLATLGDGSIDAVVSSMSLHHLPDTASLDRAFAQMARVLKPGGGIYIMDFGRLRSLTSIDYFVGRSAEGEDPALTRDYAESLRAAFSRDELASASSRHFGARARVHATVVSPLVVAIKSERRRDPVAIRRRLREIARALPRARKDDLRQLQLFLRLDGLRSAL
jgi:ubiquinone/menaquinone biosynthesis C-methylase UbiE